MVVGPAVRSATTQYDDRDVVVVGAFSCGDAHDVVEDLLSRPAPGAFGRLQQPVHPGIDVLASTLHQPVGDGDQRGAGTQLDRLDLATEPADTERRAACGAAQAAAIRVDEQRRKVAGADDVDGIVVRIEKEVN